MQILFSTHAKIVIPGFIDGPFVDNNDNLLSQYRPIPSKRRKELIGTLRDMGYDGPVEFWK